MPRLVPNPPPGFDDLSVDEKIEYLQTLWDRISASPAQVPVPDWHLDVLRERTRKQVANPDAGRSWKDVRGDIERRLRGISFEDFLRGEA